MNIYCVQPIFLSKYPWVVPIKNKKGTSIVNAFQKRNLKRKKIK